MRSILRICLWPPRMCIELSLNFLLWLPRLTSLIHHWIFKDVAEPNQARRCEEGLIRNHDRELQKAKMLIEELQTEKCKHDKDMQDAQQRIQELEDLLQTSKAEKQEALTRNHGKDMQDAQRRIQELEVLLQRSEAEKQKYLTRLSQVAAQQLRNANPNLADLSDSFRPGKLAEICNEIYDNEWSMAYDDLDGEGLESEDCERLLLEIILKCHSFCQEKGKAQMDLILEFFVATQDSTTLKLLKDERKKKATEMLPKVEKELFIMLNQDDSLSEHSNLLALPGVQAYIRACVNLCWRMAVQDPPCILYCPGSSYSATRPLLASTQSQLPTGQGREIPTRPLFDQQILKAYTASGTHIKYLVWPCMFLHEGGPLLNKGVAQGCNEH